MGIGVLTVFQRVGRGHAAKVAAAAGCCSLIALAIVAAPFHQANALSRNKERAQSTRVVTRQPESPLLLLVSIRKQRIRAFDVSGQVNASRISSGMRGFDTPTGVFSILEKKTYHESNIYEGAPMPFMQRLTWSGIALHAGVVPGYRASHGCIRLPASFAKSLFGITNVGARVIVTQDELDPIAFDHPKLFRPLPAETLAPADLRTSGEPTKVASNDKTAGGGSGIPEYLGVSTALAEAARNPDSFAQPDRPRSRAEAERMAAEKIATLKAALKAAEDAKIEASEAAKRAVAEAEALAPQIANAKKTLDPLRAAVTAADRKLNDAMSAYARFMAGGLPPSPPGKSGTKVVRVTSAADREGMLEDAILDFRIEADAARAELARQEAQFASLQPAASAAEAAREKAIAHVREAVAHLRSVQTELIDAKKQAEKRNKPVSVFISLKTQRIYVRQGFEPLLEAPITVNDPGHRLGTHVFTAMRYDERNKDQFEWRLVSAHLPASTSADADNGSRKKKKKVADKLLPHSDDTSFDMASDALDAITVPPDILDTLARLARPGASLIISDKELSASENGLGTEFVVLTR